MIVLSDILQAEYNLYENYKYSVFVNCDILTST